MVGSSCREGGMKGIKGFGRVDFGLRLRRIMGKECWWCKENVMLVRIVFWWSG